MQWTLNYGMTTYYSKQCNKSKSTLVLEGGGKNAAVLFNTIWSAHSTLYTKTCQQTVPLFLTVASLQDKCPVTFSRMRLTTCISSSDDDLKPYMCYRLFETENV